MKYLIITDTHLGIYGDSEIWHRVVLDLFEQIHDTCIREDITEIIHLGDFFHNRKTLNTKTQNVAHEIARLLGSQFVYLLVGNHDCYFKNSIKPNTLEFLNKYDHIDVVEYSKKINGSILLVPWGGSIEPDARYCMGHFQIKGFHMNDSFVCNSGYDMGIFSKFEKVFSGHFHTPSSQGVITYLGAGFQQTMHDLGGLRGYHIFDTDTAELTFVENKKSPKFLKVKADDINDRLIKNNVIKLIFEKDYGTVENEGIIDRVMKLKPIKLSVDFSQVTYENEDDQEISDISIESLENDEIISKYIEKKCKLPENLNIRTLLGIVKKFTGEINK